MTDCPFCKRIAAGEYEAWSDDPDVVWFEPLDPVTPGHMLFVPVRHVPDALADPYEAAITMEIASRWAAGKDIQPCNLITSAGPEATQSVRHMHIHLVPRRAGDGLMLPWGGQHARYQKKDGSGDV